MNAAFPRELLDAASAPYRRAGHFAQHFARGKLGGDPVFLRLLEVGLIPDGARVLDLGCGQGLLASLLLAAERLRAGGSWPAAWAAPPRPAALVGIELMAKDVVRARQALGDRAEFLHGDIRGTAFPDAEVVVILDVLHYIDFAAQEEVLRRVRAALAPGGRLLLRVGDAGAGLPFRISNWVDHAVTLARGHRLPRLHCRALKDWEALLARRGFRVESLPMSAGTPFANVLLVGRLE